MLKLGYRNLLLILYKTLDVGLISLVAQGLWSFIYSEELVLSFAFSLSTWKGLKNSLESQNHNEAQ